LRSSPPPSSLPPSSPPAPFSDFGDDLGVGEDEEEEEERVRGRRVDGADDDDAEDEQGEDLFGDGLMEYVSFVVRARASRSHADDPRKHLLLVTSRQPETTHPTTLSTDTPRPTLTTARRFLSYPERNDSQPNEPWTAVIVDFPAREPQDVIVRRLSYKATMKKKRQGTVLVCWMGLRGGEGGGSMMRDRKMMMSTRRM
jgi:hypothetical protein